MKSQSQSQEIDINKELSPARSWAENLVVKNVEEYKECIERLQDIAALRSRWVKYWSPIKLKAYAAWKEVVSREKAGLDVIDNVISKAKEAALKWKIEEERRAAEEQRRLQAEADERARKERERLEKEAAKLKTQELREAKLEAAKEIQSAVITVKSAANDVSGVSARKTWRAQVVDMDALIASAKPGTVAASFLTFNQKAADAFARSTKGTIAIPGIKFIEESGLSIKGRE